MVDMNSYFQAYRSFIQLSHGDGRIDKNAQASQEKDAYQAKADISKDETLDFAEWLNANRVNLNITQVDLTTAENDIEKHLSEMTINELLNADKVGVPRELQIQRIKELIANIEKYTTPTDEAINYIIDNQLFWDNMTIGALSDTLFKISKTIEAGYFERTQVFSKSNQINGTVPEIYSKMMKEEIEYDQYDLSKIGNILEDDPQAITELEKIFQAEQSNGKIKDFFIFIAVLIDHGGLIKNKALAEYLYNKFSGSDEWDFETPALKTAYLILNLRVNQIEIEEILENDPKAIIPEANIQALDKATLELQQAVAELPGNSPIKENAEKVLAETFVHAQKYNYYERLSTKTRNILTNAAYRVYIQKPSQHQALKQLGSNELIALMYLAISKNTINPEEHYALLMLQEIIQELLLQNKADKEKEPENNLKNKTVLKQKLKTVLALIQNQIGTTEQNLPPQTKQELKNLSITDFIEEFIALLPAEYSKQMQTNTLQLIKLVAALHINIVAPKSIQKPTKTKFSSMLPEILAMPAPNLAKLEKTLSKAAHLLPKKERIKKNNEQYLIFKPSQNKTTSYVLTQKVAETIYSASISHQKPEKIIAAALTEAKGNTALVAAVLQSFGLIIKKVQAHKKNKTESIANIELANSNNQEPKSQDQKLLKSIAISNEILARAMHPGMYNAEIIEFLAPLIQMQVIDRNQKQRNISYQELIAEEEEPQDGIKNHDLISKAGILDKYLRKSRKRYAPYYINKTNLDEFENREQAGKFLLNIQDQLLSENPENTELLLVLDLENIPKKHQNAAEFIKEAAQQKLDQAILVWGKETTDTLSLKREIEVGKTTLEKTIETLGTMVVSSKDQLVARSALAIKKILQDNPELWNELDNPEDLAQVIQCCYDNSLIDVENLEQYNELALLITKRGPRLELLINRYLEKLCGEKAQQFMEFYTWFSYEMGKRSDGLVSPAGFNKCLQGAGIFNSSEATEFVKTMESQHFVIYRPTLKMYQFTENKNLTDFFLAKFIVRNYKHDHVVGILAKTSPEVAALVSSLGLELAPGIDLDQYLAFASIDKTLEKLIIEKQSNSQEQRLTALKAQLFQSEKLAALGQLSAGVAHEIRNPLAEISMAVQNLNLIMKDKNMDKETAAVMTAQASESIERMEEMINNLLEYSRKSELHKENISIQKLLEKSLFFVRKQAKQNSINIVVEPTTGDLLCDSRKIQQVLINLVINAVQAMQLSQKSNTITISAQKVNDKTVISVTDNGPGIAPENLPKLFEAFFTTKESGTGLGLAISKEIVEQHGGSIAVNSTVGQGTMFKIELPS